MHDPIVGIDLGTTNSVVSILEDKGPKTLLIDDSKLLPSVVSLTPEGVLVGKEARNMAILEPENTIASIKRKMGKDLTVSIGDKEMRPEEISALILQKIRQAVVAHYQLEDSAVVRAVITVPAYFTEEQRSATKQAAEIAKLKVERIINEPTAAALAYGISNLEEAMYAVYDLGGGTFDVSVIESDAGLVEVRASTGNNQLGGDDFDELLAEVIWNTFVADNNLGDIKPSRKEAARLNRIAEQTKIQLSEVDSVEIQESFFYKQEDVNYHLEQVIGRADFEDLIRDKIEETVKHLSQAILEADLTRSDLNGIILVGGSSRIPLVSTMIEEKLKIKPVLIGLPDEAVSHGATIQGSIINKLDSNTVLIDITPHSLGIGTMDEQTTSVENMMKVMKLREEAEAKGEEIKEEDLPLDLVAAVLIPKNTPIPVKRSDFFYAASEFQKAYIIEVFQGEGKRFGENKMIGETLLKVKDPVEEGKIKVTFELDINGLLNVTAVEVNTNEVVHAQFQSSTGQTVTDTQVAKMRVLASFKTATENTLLKRATAMLEREEVEQEDKVDLQVLVDQYKNEEAAGNTEGLSKIEEEILDLLYYLEKEEV